MINVSESEWCFVLLFLETFKSTSSTCMNDMRKFCLLLGQFLEIRGLSAVSGRTRRTEKEKVIFNGICFE